MLFEENINNQSDMDNKAYSPTWSFHPLSDTDHNHNLKFQLSFTSSQ